MHPSSSRDGDENCRQGYLRRQRSFRDSFRRKKESNERFAVLRGRTLSLYEKKNDMTTKQEPKVSVDITDIAVYVGKIEEHDTMKYYVKITNKKDAWMFSTESQHERDEWFGTILSAVTDSLLTSKRYKLTDLHKKLSGVENTALNDIFERMLSSYNSKFSPKDSQKTFEYNVGKCSQIAIKETVDLNQNHMEPKRKLSPVTIFGQCSQIYRVQTAPSSHVNPTEKIASYRKSIDV